MIIVYVLLAALILYRIKYLSYNKDYMSFESTNAIKGIFILMVFISHYNYFFLEIGYDYASLPDKIFLFLQRRVDQWIVALFLFYSGYGILESIKKKGHQYIDQFPKKRLLTVLLNFDVAVLCFLFINYLCNYTYPWQKCLLSFIGWDEVGNSNWYIFIILVCYLIVYISFLIARQNISKGLWISCSLTVLSMIILYFVKENYWYNTILCFPLGLIFSLYKQKIESFMSSYYKILLIIGIICYYIGVKLGYIYPMTYNIAAISMVLFVLLITMKFSIKNRYLVWCGTHLFPLYIYQRIPLVIFHDSPFVKEYPLTFWAACFITTLLIAHFYKYWQIKFK